MKTIKELKLEIGNRKKEIKSLKASNRESEALLEDLLFKKLVETKFKGAKSTRVQGYSATSYRVFISGRSVELEFDGRHLSYTMDDKILLSDLDQGFITKFISSVIITQCLIHTMKNMEPVVKQIAIDRIVSTGKVSMHEIINLDLNDQAQLYSMINLLLNM